MWPAAIIVCTCSAITLSFSGSKCLFFYFMGWLLGVRFSLCSATKGDISGRSPVAQAKTSEFLAKKLMSSVFIFSTNPLSTLLTLSGWHGITSTSSWLPSFHHHTYLSYAPWELHMLCPSTSFTEFLPPRSLLPCPYIIYIEIYRGRLISSNLSTRMPTGNLIFW